MIEIDIDSAGLQRAGADAEILAKKLEGSDERFFTVFQDAANAAKGSVHKISGKLQGSIKPQRTGQGKIILLFDVPYASAEFRRGGSHSTFVEDAIRMLDQGTGEMVSDIIGSRQRF